MTRPYTWRRLLAAKALFIILFVTLPLLAAQCAILAATGFAPTSYLPGLLWKQLGLTVVFVLPAFALATIARGLVQFATFAIVFGVCWIAWTVVIYSTRGPAGDWVQQSILGAIIAAGALAALFRQYARRTTYASCGILMCAAALMIATGALVPWSSVAALREGSSASSSESSIVLGLDTNQRGSPGELANATSGLLRNLRTPQPGSVEIDLPISVTGLADGVDLDIGRMTVTMARPAVSTWGLNGLDLLPLDRSVAFVRRSPGLYMLGLPAPQSFFDAVKSGTVDCRISMDLTLFSDVSAIPLPAEGTTIEVPGLGSCSSRLSNRWRFVCASPLRMPARIVLQPLPLGNCIPDRDRVLYEQISRVTWGDWYSPFPAEFGFSPLTSFWFEAGPPRKDCGSSSFSIIPQRSVAHFHRDLVIPDLRLADYAIQ